jgi:YVTN family beta-propeller protein
MKKLVTFILLLLPAVLTSAQTGTLIVLNKSDNNASLIDLATKTVIATIPTGVAPHEVAVSPDGTLAVVSNYGAKEPGNSLTVIDIPARRKREDLDLGEHKRPHGIAWLKDGKHVVVTSEASKALLVVDVESGTVVRALETQSDISHMVALTPDSSRAFVANIGSGSITAFDLREQKSGTNLGTGAGSEGLDVSPDGREVWVASRQADTVSVVNTAKLKVVATLESKAFPIRVKFTPDGKYVLVSHARSGDVAVYDARSKKELRRIKMDVGPVDDASQRVLGNQFGASSAPIGILIPPDGQRAYIANSNADMLAVIDLKDWTIVDHIKTSKEPDGMGYSKIVLTK